MFDATPDTLIEQARKTTAGHLRAAVVAVDREFGEGYAKKNPALVIAFLQVAARDFEVGIRVVYPEGFRAPEAA